MKYLPSIYLQNKHAKRSTEQAMKTTFFLSFLYIGQIRTSTITPQGCKFIFSNGEEDNLDGVSFIRPFEAQYTHI